MLRRGSTYPMCFGALVTIALIGGCTQGPDSKVDDSATASALAAGPTASAVKVTLSPRVLPGGSTRVTIEATVAGLRRGATVVASFTGDAGYWGAANLSVTNIKKDRYTFSAMLNAPKLVGVHDMSWQLVASPGGAFGAPITATLEITCSDGIFCNGEERYTVRGCVAGPPPCIDGVACTDDLCDEASRTCELAPKNTACSDCAEKNCNPRCGPHQQCGADGCGGQCITANTDGAGNCLSGFCVEGSCVEVAEPGTCTLPLPLYGTDGVIPVGGASFTVLGDSSLPGFDLVKLSCGVDGIPDRVYEFTVTEKVGLDIRTLSQDGDPAALDTVLAVHLADCVTQAPFPGFCSDDASPPGGYGSRVYGPLDPGTYKLIVTGFSAAQTGPFQAQVKFVPGCVPVCDGKYCGDDGCNGTCGSCTGTDVCNTASARCEAAGSSCVPDCKNKECGPDGCGGTCGSCGATEVCGETEGQCVALSGCDHFKPVCKQKCGPKSYCGSDCACHAVDEVLVDLAPAPASMFLPTIEFEWRDFSNTSCSLVEGCVPGPGRWLLMRFTTDVVNYGLGSFEPGDPTANPEFFDYSACHQHFHFSGFANFSLKTYDGKSVLSGHKLSYCMEDSYPMLTGPTIPCEAKFTCDDQGIQAGWVDSYASTLDCQWVVLRGTTPAPTDIAPGWYLHETCTNTGRFFHEGTFDNNCAQVPVYIPDVPDNGQSVRYVDITPPPRP